MDDSKMNMIFIDHISAYTYNRIGIRQSWMQGRRTENESGDIQVHSYNRRNHSGGVQTLWIFRIIVPLDESFSFDYEVSIETTGKTIGKIRESAGIMEVTTGKIEETTDKTTGKAKETTDKTTGKTKKTTDKPAAGLTSTEEKILKEIRINPHITQMQLAARIGITADGIRYAIKNLKVKGILRRTGGRKNGSWTIL